MTPTIDDLHRLLLRAAGRSPDSVVCHARARLADGATDQVIGLLAAEALAGRLALTGEQAAALRVSGPVPATEELFPYVWTPAGPDPLDEAAVAYARATAVTALWRTRRHPAVPTAWPPPKPVFLVQAAGGAAALAGALQRTLAAAGGDDPLVEVFAEPDELPSWHRQALARAELLWAAEPAPELRIVPTFDLVDEQGRPVFRDDRPVLAEPEAAKVVAYLAAGTLLLSTPEPDADLFDEDGPRVVPMGIRGDGRWLWSESVTYYAERHGIAPAAELLDAIRAAGYVCPPLSAAAVHRSVDLILATVHAAEEEPG